MQQGLSLLFWVQKQASGSKIGEAQTTSFSFWCVSLCFCPLSFPLAILIPDFLFCFILLLIFLGFFCFLISTNSFCFSFSIFDSSDFLSCFCLPHCRHARLKCLPQTFFFKKVFQAFFGHFIPFLFPSHQITSLYLKNLTVPAAEGCMMQKHRKPWGLQTFPPQE